MDGLLIDSEDVITRSTNRLLEKYGRPPFTSSIRARLMGVPDSTNGDVFHDWAQLPISRPQFARELKEQLRLDFPQSRPLPGARELVTRLSGAHGAGGNGDGIALALASSTKTDSYELKTSSPQVGEVMRFFRPDRRVLGDDPRLRPGRGKPAPDIYLLALHALNSPAGRAAGGEGTSGTRAVLRPEECLVFEDSVAGVEAARRAGMRVVWVPHPDVAVEYQAVRELVLAGRSGMFEIGDDWLRGAVGDGRAECISSLQHFDYEKYGIIVPP
ncbi:GS1-like protein [Cordyceps javanica]|nr:GS1-like protein [Cordyceps javanica]